MDNPAESSDRLHFLLGALRLSQKKFADELGLSQSAVSQLLSRKTRMSVDTLGRVCRTWNVDANWLALGMGEPFRRKNQAPEGARPAALVGAGLREAYAQNPGLAGGLPAAWLPEGWLDFRPETRLFEIGEPWMAPALLPGDYAFAARTRPEEAPESALCLAVTEGGLVPGRWRPGKREAWLWLDQDAARGRRLPYAQIRELWLVEGKFTRKLPYFRL